MDKKTVAETLGVGIRAVERYAEQGKLSVTYKKGRTRPVAVYNEAEVKALKAALEAALFPVRPSVELTATQASSANTEQPASGILRSTDVRQVLAIFVEALQNVPEQKTKLSIADIAFKPMLKLDEATRLTGFGKDVLLEAHNQGKLKMEIMKGAWRIKRTDLNAFIENLF